MGVETQRFEAKVDRSGEHHLWTGAKTAAGFGQVRIAGRLRTTAQVAWELANGPIPPGARVVGCPHDPACVHIEHLGLDTGKSKSNSTSPATRANRGGGAMSETRPGVWKLTVEGVRDEDGHRVRAYRTVDGGRREASKALAAFIVEVGDGSGLPTRSSHGLTVNELVEWYLAFARDERGLEHSTLVGYSEVYELWLRPSIGSVRAGSLEAGALDKVFGKMRRAGLSYSRMNNARALLSGAYRWGRRHRKVSSNPVDRLEIPASSKGRRETATPELDELLLILNGADEHEPELAPVLKLGATTGMRRGELSGLRRNRIHLDRHELSVDTAINDAGGVVVEKSTKTKRNRIVSLDAATIELLSQHLAAMDERAEVFGVTIPPDGFVFSVDPACEVPMRPELMTRRMRQLRKRLGIRAEDFDATILALRKWTSSELMDAGFNPSTVSGRQGHSVQVMLHHYSTRRRSADQAAAEHLGARVHGTAVNG